jgi:ribosomal protein S8
LPEIILIYNKKSELAIKAQFIESLNTENYLKEFEVEKTYKDISLSYNEIKNRKEIIIKIFKDLKTEKIIDNRITICFKDIAKGKAVIEVKELTNNLLGKLSKISFTERWG